MNFSTRLKSSLKAAGLTQIALARATGLKQSAISSYCNDNGLPSAEALYQIAKALHVSMEWLLVGDAENNQSSDNFSWQARALAAEKKLEVLKAVYTHVSAANSELSKII